MMRRPPTAPLADPSQCGRADSATQPAARGPRRAAALAALIVLALPTSAVAQSAPALDSLSHQSLLGNLTAGFS